MAKKYVFKADGKDLAQVPMTQNENGVFYRNSAGTYYKPILANFDNASLPSGYRKYIGGSHAKYLSNSNRNPLDLSIVAGANLTANVDVKVLGSTPNDGSWCKVQPVGSDMVVGLVHTYQWRSGIVKAGNIICKVAPQSVTGFAPHLHIDEWSNKGRRIRELILNGDFNMSTFKKGDKIKITATQNIRKAPAGTITGDSKVGWTGFIYDNPRDAVLDGKNYTWYDIHFDGGGSGWLADVGKFEIYTPEPPKPPVDPILELKERINTLTKEIEGLREALRASESKNVELKAELDDKIEEMQSLAGEAGELKAEMKTLEEKYGTLMIEKKTLANTNMELVRELNEMKEKVNMKWWDKLAEVLANLFKKE